MKIFIVSRFGDSLDIAEKLNSEGHQVVLYVRNKQIELPGNEVQITTNPTADMLKSELLLVEDVSSGEFVEKARKLNRPVLGGSIVSTRLLTDSRFGSEALIGCGLKLAKERTQGQFIEVGGWFVNGEFLKPYFISWKYMQFGSGNVGPEVGPMGLVGIYRLKGKIFRESLEKTQAFLKSIGYIGYMGLDLYVNNDNLQVYGWQPGFNYPSMNVIASMHGNLGQFLFRVATEKSKVAAVQPNRSGVGITYLNLPWLYERPAKHRPKIICEPGACVEEAISKAYKSVHKNINPDSYYRDDIGRDWIDSWDRLGKWGWV